MDKLDDKPRLRAHLRQRRRDTVEAMPAKVRALVFHRPPTALVGALRKDAVVGLYHALGSEAPTLAYARWFQAQGWALALPWFADAQPPQPEAAMRFRAWANPWVEAGLVPGPHHALQPADDAAELAPDIVFVPLLGFTEECARLGQGGGHYDRWLAAHPQARAIGLAWDCQLVEDLPQEPHDWPLSAVITPTRVYSRPESRPERKTGG